MSIKMSETEIKERIQYLEREIFILDMKDHWDSNDRSYIHELKTELETLKDDDNHD